MNSEAKELLVMYLITFIVTMIFFFIMLGITGCNNSPTALEDRECNIFDAPCWDSIHETR